MTSHFDSGITTDLKSEMISGFKTGNRIPNVEEMYMALRMGMHGRKTTYFCKGDKFKPFKIYQIV